MKRKVELAKVQAEKLLKAKNDHEAHFLNKLKTKKARELQLEKFRAFNNHQKEQARLK